MLRTTELKAFAATLGLDCIGIAPAQLPYPEPLPAAICPLAAGQGEERYAPTSLLPHCQSVIVILFPYYTGQDGQANVARYCRCHDYHSIVHDYLERISAYLRDHYPPHECLPIVDTAPLSDRWLAYQAGLGFYGDNHCFINERYGSYCFIGSILTTLPFEPDAPVQQECHHCGACHRACPGQCFAGRAYDYNRCKSYLTQKKGSFTLPEIDIMTKTPLIWGCDVCQDVCPHNQHIAMTPINEFYRNRLSFLSKEHLENLSNKQFQQAFGMRAFAWRGKKTLLRNIACLESRD